MTLGPRGLDLSRQVRVLVRVWTYSGCLVDRTHVGLGGGFAGLAIYFLGGGPSFTFLCLAILHGLLNPCAAIAQLLKIHDRSRKHPIKVDGQETLHHYVHLVLLPKTINHFGGLLPPSHQVFGESLPLFLFNGL